jgi:iron complex outermembrane recepter protein
MQNRKLGLLAGISLAAMCQPAIAQDADTATEEAAAEEQIVVTGTRITANGDNLPTPVTVASTDELLKTSPSNIPDGLNKLPIFALSRGAANLNNPTDNFTGNYLNLRGFGIQRNLILLDGHRMSPTSYTGAVDTNVIPQMLLKRVEVVTGGASAVYGSDAVSGVVNFILDKKFTGLKAEAQSGISSRGDARSWRAGAAFGTNFANDRGHFMASFEHFQQDGLDDKESRKNGRAVYAVAGSGTNADPFRLVSNARNSVIDFAGTYYQPDFLFGINPAAFQNFGPTGLLEAPNFGTPQGGALTSGGDGFYGKGSSATADLKTDQAFARVDYDVTDGISFYAQGNYAKAHTFNNFYPNLLFPGLAPIDNAFIPAATQAAITAQYQPAVDAGFLPPGHFFFARVFDSPQHTLGVRAESESWMASAGLNGEAGSLNWNLHYQHGVSKTVNTQVNNILLGNLAASLDAVDEGVARGGAANGRIVCRVSVTNPTVYPGCVPLNAFGAAASSQAAALDFITGDNNNVPKFTMDSFEASLSGTAFDNWAGPVRFALSGEYRKLSLGVTTNSPAGVFADCTGLSPFLCTPGGTSVYRDAQITPISKKENVKEAAIEVDFPLLRDSAVGSLSLSGAARYTDYSISGSEYTWKVGGDWQITDGLRFRGTRSRDIRAPSLWELFQPVTNARSGYFDIHTGTAGSGTVATENGGNSSLVPERADTLTFGAVWRPQSVPGLSFAVDYYKIKIGNAVSVVDGRLPSIQNLCEASNGTSNFCSLYVRPNPFSDRSAANFPTLVRTVNLNASSVKTWGIDGEVNYTFNVGGDGRILLRGLVGYQPQLTTILVPGATPQLGAGAAATQSTGGVPKLRLTAFVGYSNSDFSVDLQQRWRSSLKWNPDRTLIFSEPDVPSVAYTDATFTFFPGKDKDKQIFFSVQNLFDKNPPPYLTAGTSGTPAFSFPATTGDDIIGRYFTVGAKMKF